MVKKKDDNWMILIIILIFGIFVFSNYQEVETPLNDTDENGGVDSGGPAGNGGDDGTDGTNGDGEAEGEEQGEGQLLCSAVWNPSPTTCSQAYCETGECTYKSATLVSPGKCECRTCTDSDGGIVYDTWGYCEDDTTMAGFPDTCSDEYTLIEYFCNEENVCDSVSHSCSVGEYGPELFLCESGACV